MRGAIALVLVCLGAGSLAGCEGEESSDELSILDPAKKHLNRTYAEWAAEWIKYIHKSSPADDCADTIQDTTGEFCTLYQTPESGVFFLSGTYGGPARRRCVIPSGVALFFPIINIWNDNAGVAEEEVLQDSELKTFTQAVVDKVNVDSLYVTLDSKNVGGVEAGLLEEPAPYTINLPAGPNTYACYGVPDVVGEFRGYTGGAWAMLAPLSKGQHRLEFGGMLDSATAGEAPFSLDVTYDLTVE